MWIWVASALAAPVPADQLGAALAEVRAKHQAPFLLGVNWDTVKPCEKLVAGGLDAVVRRLPDEFSAASNALNEQLARGEFACAVLVMQASNDNYSLYRFGDCDNPPAAPRPVASKGPLPADPAKVGTFGVTTLVAPTDLATALGGFDPSVARERAAAELVARRWPTADKPRYVATGVVKEAACAPAGRTTCRVAIAWSVTDTARQAPVYEVLARGEASEADAKTAGDAAFLAALDSLMSRPALLSRLDPTPSAGADPAPDWTGEIGYAPCEAAPQALPAGAPSAFAGIGTATAGSVTGPLLVISPDGTALVPVEVAVAGLTGAVGDRSAPAAVLRIDATLGIAAVRLQGDGWACAPFGGGAPSAGSKVFVAGATPPASGAITGVQSVAALQLARSSLKIDTSGTALWDSAGSVRAIASTHVALPGLSGAAIGVPASVVLDRLDLKPGESEPNPASKAGRRGAALPPVTVDAPDP